MGNSHVTGLETVTFTDNMSFDGTERGGAMSADGQLWIGSATSNRPNNAGHVRLGTLTGGTGITITNGPGTIAIAANGAVLGQTITGDTGGALSPTAGNWNIITDNTTVKFAGATSTLTQDFGLTNLIMGSSATGITTATFSVGVGFEALDVLSSGLGNTAVGYHSCLAVTTAGSNTAVGQNSLLDDISSPGNTAIGHSSLVSLLSGDGSNTAIGINSGGSCATGTQNVFVGANSGSACNSSESSNILIKNIGAAAESNTIRIGTVGSGAGQQNRAFVAAITGVTVAGSAPVGVDTNGQLSSLGFGTAGQILTSNGAATSPTFQTAASVAGSLRLIQTQTVSNVATVDFTNIGSYTTYMFLVQGAKPPSGNQILWLRVSTDNGSSFSTSGYAAGINYSVYNSATITNANSTAAVLVSGNAISSSSNFDADAIIYFYHANSAQNPHVSGVCKWVSSVPIGTMGDIQAGIAVTGVNAFRFMMDSGNITGTFSIYGIATS